MLRAAERALSGLLFQEPPRTTRASSQGTLQNIVLRRQYAKSGNQKQSKIYARRRFAAHSEQQPSASAFSAPANRYSMGDEHNTRKPKP